MADTAAIYTYGGGEALNLVFQGIAMTLGQGGVLNSMLKISGSIGIMWAAIVAVVRGSINEAGKWFFWFILCINIFILPKGSIWIKDELSKDHYKIDNVPLVMGIIASNVSTIGNGITKTMEQNFSVPDDVKYHKTGMVFASKLVSMSTHFKVIDADFKENLDNFVNRCIVYDSMIGYKYTKNELKTTDDIWNLVKTNASEALGMMYRYPKAASKEAEIITCKAAALTIEKEWKNQIQLLSIKYGNKISQNSKTDIKIYFQNSLAGTFGYLTNLSKSAEDVIKQEMMINAIDEASHNKVTELGGPTNYASTKALLQQRSTYQITGELAGRLLPAMKVVLEAIAYGAFLFVIILAVMPNGYRIISTYFGLLIWIQMWPPLYAILNLLMTVYAKSETTSYIGSNGLNMLTSSGISEINTDIQALAGYLSMSIPFLSYAIVKGGAQSFIHLAGHLGSAIQSASSATANEVASGNISLGNYSQGVMAYNNTSAFQHQSSPYYNSGQFKHVGDQGEIFTTQPGGRVVITGGPGNSISSGGLHVNANQAMTKQLSEGLNNAQTIIDSTSKEIASAESSAYKQTADLAERVMKGTSSGESYNLNTQTGERTSFGKMVDLADSLKNQHGWSDRQSVEAAMSASVGAKILGTGVEIKTNFSSNVARDQAVIKGRDLANKQNYSESLENVQNSAKDIRFGENQSEEKTLSNNISGSIEKINSAREAQSIALQESDTYSKALNYMHSDGFNIYQNLDQELLEQVANKPSNIGAGKIGYNEANLILSNPNHPLRHQFVNEFAKQHTAQLLNQIKHENYSDNYQIRAGQLKSRVNNESLEQVQGKANDQGLNNLTVNSEVKDKVENNIAKGQRSMSKNKNSLDKQNNNYIAQTNEENN